MMRLLACVLAMFLFGTFRTRFFSFARKVREKFLIG